MDIKSLLPIIIPLVILEVVLTGAALMHIFNHKTYKHGNRAFWAIISFINIIGPVLYFIIGRGDE